MQPDVRTTSAGANHQNSSPASVAPAPTASLAPPLAGLDPFQLVIPPPLAPAIFGWMRRLALQSELHAADRVLREAFADLTSSLSVTILYPSPEGMWSLGIDDERPHDVQPIVGVATARRAVISSHSALVPIVTPHQTIAVVALERNSRQPGYTLLEQVAMIGFAREATSIVHHLIVEHLQRATMLGAEKGSLYRREALEAHRTRGHEGSPVSLSPAWVRRTYPMLVVTLLAALAFSVFIKIPTYSSGTGLVVIDGASITAAQSGTVAQVLVQPGEAVTEGAPLVRLDGGDEQDELTHAQTEFETATVAYLFDQTDGEIRKTLASAHSRVVLAEARVNAKTIRATKPGTVSDVRVRAGQALKPGDHVLSIVDPGAQPEVVALLPSKDRPRLAPGMELQVELVGYNKTREDATISSVSSEAIGGSEAAKYVGATLADALQLPPGESYVIVHAQLPTRTFATDHHELHYHHGMLVRGEVKIASKPFLASLLPALDRYLSD